MNTAFNDLVSALIILNRPIKQMVIGDLIILDEKINDCAKGLIFYHGFDDVILKIQYAGMNSGKYIYILMESVII